MALKKSVVDIELMDRPRARNSKRQNCPNCGWLNNWTESFSEVNTRPLSKSTKYPTSFVALKTPISMKLVLEYPLAGNHISSSWPRQQIPSVVGQEGRKLSFHCCSPVWISKSSTITPWNR